MKDPVLGSVTPHNDTLQPEHSEDTKGLQDDARRVSRHGPVQRALERAPPPQDLSTATEPPSADGRAAIAPRSQRARGAWKPQRVYRREPARDSTLVLTKPMYRVFLKSEHSLAARLKTDLNFCGSNSNNLNRKLTIHHHVLEPLIVSIRQAAHHVSIHQGFLKWEKNTASKWEAEQTSRCPCWTGNVSPCTRR